MLVASFVGGKYWEFTTPKVKVFGTPLNPGPFTIKEHVLVTLMGTIGAAPAFGVSSDH